VIGKRATRSPGASGPCSATANKEGCVAFGSTTGNLYVSDDGGEGWMAVANNLPPIYSVRFA